MRVHVDATVPRAVVEELRAGGAQVVPKPPRRTLYDGLLWRFEPLADPALRRVLVRDIDSVVSVKERVAVEAWIASGRHFHAMRDFHTHTDLVLAGLWGGVGGILPPTEAWLKAYRSRLAPTANLDQWLLRFVAWPTIRRSVLVHDSIHAPEHGEPFPPFATLPPWSHVGQAEPWKYRARALARAVA